MRESHRLASYNLADMYMHTDTGVTSSEMQQGTDTHLVNAASGGFGRRLALGRRSVHGLSPDRADRPVGLHGSVRK